MAIDFGIASEVHEAPEKHIKRAIQFILPALEPARLRSSGQQPPRSLDRLVLKSARQELIEVANEIA